MLLIIFTGVLLSLTAVALIVVVLMQNPKNEGGGYLSEDHENRQLVDVTEMPQLLHKVTYGLVIALVGLTLAFSYLLNDYYYEATTSIENF